METGHTWQFQGRIKSRSGRMKMPRGTHISTGWRLHVRMLGFDKGGMDAFVYLRNRWPGMIWYDVDILSGWWFGPFFIFPCIGNFIIPVDFHIFQRGGSTTNQLWYVNVDPFQISWGSPLQPSMTGEDFPDPRSLDHPWCWYMNPYKTGSFMG